MNHFLLIESKYKQQKKLNKTNEMEWDGNQSEEKKRNAHTLNQIES